jgi:hypothetical protein
VTVSRILVWWTRVTWAVLAVVAAPAWSDALAGHSTPVRVTAGIAAWTAWGVALIAVAAMSAVSLTVSRLIITIAVPATVIVAVHEPGVWSVTSVVLAGAAGVGVMSAEFARAHIQASAYGAEERFPLRPPAPFVGPMVLAWATLAVAWLVGPLALAAKSWVIGGVLSAAAVVLTVVLGRRFHRMTRRWLVLVPVGLVLHDHLLLAETVLMRRNDLIGMRLAAGGPDAIDLTGLTWGAAVQIDAREPQVVIPRVTGRGPEASRPVSVRTIVIAPSRPGQLLAAARRTRFTAP